MLYLVTSSDRYYPTAGDGDWRLLTSDKHAARMAFYRETQGDVVYLIALSPDGTYSGLDVRWI